MNDETIDPNVKSAVSMAVNAMTENFTKRFEVFIKKQFNNYAQDHVKNAYETTYKIFHVL